MFIAFAGGAGGFSFARTSKSFMFLGRLKATIDGSVFLQSARGMEDWEVFLCNPQQVGESRMVHDY